MSCVSAPPQPPTMNIVNSHCTKSTTDNTYSCDDVVACAGLVVDPVTGAHSDMNAKQLAAVWQTQDCGTVLYNNFFPNGVFDGTSFALSQQAMANALYIYFTPNSFTPSPYDASVTQSQLLQACYDVPGLCDYSAVPMCTSCTRDQIAQGYNLLEFCGCHATPDPAFSELGSFQTACDPLCTNGISAKLRDNATGAVAECNQTVCVINNVTLNAYATSLQNINFAQVCNACVNNNATCQCYIDVSIPNIISTMGLEGPNLQQNCPFNQCYTVDNNSGKITNVDCGSYNQVNVSTPVSKYLWWLLIFLLVIIVLAIFSFAYWGLSFEQVSFQLFRGKGLKHVERYSSLNLPK